MKKQKCEFSRWVPWMYRALQLALLAEGQTSPNPLVGAVVLDKEGKLVGEGFHSGAGNPHAEVKALTQAGEKAKGGTVVVTLEPCCHQGKTPPCTKAILLAGVCRVVVAMKDPDPRVHGNGISSLRSAGIEVITGVLEEEAAYQNRAFVFRIQTGRPWGILKWAMSLDGRLALPNGDSKWISGIKARSWVHQLRSKSDAVIVGGGTVRADNPLLTSRGIVKKEPIRVIVTRSLQLPKKAQLWDVSVARTLIAYGSDASAKSVENLPSGPDRLEIDSPEPILLLKSLAGKGCNCVLWECGPALATEAIKQNCVQELHVVVAPKLLGGISARTALNNFGFKSLDEAYLCQLQSVQKLDEDLLLTVMSIGGGS